MNQKITKNKNSFEHIFDQVWKMLQEGAEIARHDFHLGILSTIENGKPQNRTVVLRRVIKENNALIFHTNKRSGKVKEISANPNISWLFYSKENKIQLRLSGTAIIHKKDALFSEQWYSSRLMSRKCYLTEHDPGSSIDDHDDYLTQSLKEGIPTEEESELGKINFAAVETVINSIDWLYLKASGHQRTKFTINKNRFEGKWIVP